MFNLLFLVLLRLFFFYSDSHMLIILFHGISINCIEFQTKIEWIGARCTRLIGRAKEIHHDIAINRNPFELALF